MEFCKPTEGHRSIPCNANTAVATALDSTYEYVDIGLTAATHVDGCNDNFAPSLSTTRQPHMPLPAHTG
jgi:hypothetical protein